jgi:hypothetical protein
VLVDRAGEGDHRCEERRRDPVPAEIGIHEQHVDIAVVIQVGEPGHVAIDDGHMGVRCCPGRGPRVEIPIVGRPRLDLLRRVVGLAVSRMARRKITDVAWASPAVYARSSTRRC